MATDGSVAACAKPNFSLEWLALMPVLVTTLVSVTPAAARTFGSSTERA